ncbi:hypothetical protein ACFQL0_10890 [Haloplanus litoreus]|uniref:hypothetical protein n=1 Tax=Haloplanus litoreus TaxID=767515 RepID=UPI003612D82C
MPEIEITPEQEERLRALQEDIARDVVGKYGHVRPRDAVEYLLDRYEEDEDADPADASGTQTATAGSLGRGAGRGGCVVRGHRRRGATARVVAGEGATPPTATRRPAATTPC